MSRVSFSKKRGLAVPAMVQNSWVYRKLRDFRAGIESAISLLKRVFGLPRCVWKGAAGFQTYVRTAVLAANLLTPARHRLARAARAASFTTVAAPPPTLAPPVARPRATRGQVASGAATLRQPHPDLGAPARPGHRLTHGHPCHRASRSPLLQDGHYLIIALT